MEYVTALTGDVEGDGTLGGPQILRMGGRVARGGGDWCRPIHKTMKPFHEWACTPIEFLGRFWNLGHPVVGIIVPG